MPGAEAHTRAYSLILKKIDYFFRIIFSRCKGGALQCNEIQLYN